ncbi:unnamed protein product, partial [Phaeothamnion confervicola]
MFTVENVRGPFLVVVPLSTIEHWRREVAGWTDMTLCVYHDVGGGTGGTASEMRAVIREYEWYYAGRPRSMLKCHVLVTTYDDLTRDQTALSSIPWRAVVVDEAHRLRNQESKLLEALRGVLAKGQAEHDYQHRILMTGTPMQNNIGELWSLLNFIQPDVFANGDHFMRTWGDIHEEHQVRTLQGQLAPYLLRRVKEDVASDIPPKEETIVEVELTMLQKQYYRAILEKNHAVLSRSGGGRAQSMPSLMNVQMELRKCCNHPFMVRGVEDYEVELVSYGDEDGKNGKQGKKTRVGEEGRREVLRQRARLEKGLVQGAGKMVLLDKLLPKLQSEDHKVLIFSQFIGMIDMLSEFCRLRGFKHERLDGRVTGNERQRAIDRFNTDPSAFVFLLSTRAGGVGINLTAADTCIIYDSDWNPQNDIQAMARCHRIGQTKDVSVYRLITRNSFEQEMFERASKKLGLERAVLGDAERSEKMTSTEMERLLRQGAYAIMNEDEDDERAAREFNEMSIDKILEQRSR